MTNNESGRSMVEMLGVLAIIGVLSVMGIAGYTQAMRKYKANEAAQELSIAAMLCASTGGFAGLSADHITPTDCEQGTTTVVKATLKDAEQALVIATLGGRGGVDGNKVTITIS